MTRLGMRLAVAGGKEAIGRLALIAVAVAIGACLLLATLAGVNAFRAQDERSAWLETGFGGADVSAAVDDGPPPDAPAGADPLWWLLRADHFRGEEILRIDLAATGPRSPVPPGIPGLPGPGELYVSPSLATLLDVTPAAELGDRFPGTRVGVIGAAALPAPDSLVAVVGRDAADLARQDGAGQVTQISTTPPSECSGACAPVGVSADGMTVVLTVVAAALLFPVLIFIGGATRLSAARREQRFAAMRLVGATRRQIATLATVEAGIATIAGVVAGFGLFYALRPAIATIPFTGERFFAGDLALGPAHVLLVALGVPIGASVAARIALRRVRVSPLGVTRQVTPRPPRAWRLIPLLAGIAELGYLAYLSDVGETASSAAQAYAYLLGIFSIMIGLVVAGPWLTRRGSRLVARRSRRPAGLIAARRLGDNSQAAFRAVSGVVLAVFVGTVTVGVITTIVAGNTGTVGDTVAAGTVVQNLYSGRPSDTPARPMSDEARAELTSIPGVHGVTPIHLEHTAAPDGDRRRPDILNYVSCAHIADTPALGRCPDGTETVEVVPRFGGAVIDGGRSMAETTWPAADVSLDELSAMPVGTIVVGTDGSSAAVERARTVLERRYPAPYLPQTLGERAQSDTLDSYRQLANVVLLASLPIAGCSLAVSVAGGLAERRRPFSLLRLTGVPLATLRRVVTLEAAVPLLVSVAVSAGVGLLAAGLFARAQLDQPLEPPGLQYGLLVVGGVVASLAIIASTLPLLGRMTGPDTARND